MLIIGLDPSLTCTGWGIVARQGNRLSHVANGQIRTDPKASLAERLVTLDNQLSLRLQHQGVGATLIHACYQNTGRFTHAGSGAKRTNLIFGADAINDFNVGAVAQGLFNGRKLYRCQPHHLHAGPASWRDQELSFTLLYLTLLSFDWFGTACASLSGCCYCFRCGARTRFWFCCHGLPFMVDRHHCHSSLLSKRERGRSGSIFKLPSFLNRCANVAAVSCGISKTAVCGLC